MLILTTNLPHERIPHPYRIQDHHLHPGLPRPQLRTTNQENLAPGMACLLPSLGRELHHHLPPPKGTKCHHRLRLERFNHHSRLVLMQYRQHLPSAHLLCRRRRQARPQQQLRRCLPAPLVLCHLLRQERAHRRHLLCHKPLDQPIQRLLVVLPHHLLHLAA